MTPQSCREAPKTLCDIIDQVTKRVLKPRLGDICEIKHKDDAIFGLMLCLGRTVMGVGNHYYEILDKREDRLGTWDMLWFFGDEEVVVIVRPNIR